MATVGDVGEKKLIEIMLRHITPMLGMPVPFWARAIMIEITTNESSTLFSIHARAITQGGREQGRSPATDEL